MGFNSGFKGLITSSSSYICHGVGPLVDPFRSPEVSSKVCHDSFCQLGNSVSLSWVIFYAVWNALKLAMVRMYVPKCKVVFFVFGVIKMETSEKKWWNKYKVQYDSNASYFFILNVAPDRVSCINHWIATLLNSIRIIGAFNCHNARWRMLWTYVLGRAWRLNFLLWKVPIQ